MSQWQSHYQLIRHQWIWRDVEASHDLLPNALPGVIHAYCCQSWALENVRKKMCLYFYVVSICEWKNEKPKKYTTNNGTQEQYRTPSLFFFVSFSPLICVSVGVHVCLSVHFAYVCVHVPDSEDLWREQLDCHWAQVHARQHFLFQYFALSRHLAAQLSHIPQIHTDTHSFINSWIM
jgi:hypothetical protein